jgi:hypothetical protein
MSPSLDRAQVTVVTCVEAGQLENEVVTMVASLRRWGGALADAPVIAVTPRVGPPLRATTRRAFDALRVKHVSSLRPHAYGWNGFMNKPQTLLRAAPHIETSHGLWLDGDTIVVDALDALLEQPSKRFLACVEELGPVSDGPANAFDSFWLAIAKALGMGANEIPWVTAPFSERRIRAYCNSGVFRYRVNWGLEESYEKAFRTLLDSHLVPRDDPSIFLHEQIALGLVAARSFGFEELPCTYNFHVGKEYEVLYRPNMLQKAKIIHYHRVMRSQAARTRFLDQLVLGRPDVAAFMASSNVARDARPHVWRAPHKVLRMLRERAQQKHMHEIVRI